MTIDEMRIIGERYGLVDNPENRDGWNELFMLRRIGEDFTVLLWSRRGEVNLMLECQEAVHLTQDPCKLDEALARLIVFVQFLSA